MPLHKPNSMGEPGYEATKALRANFRRIDRREWWLWAAAFTITLLLIIGLTSFLIPSGDFHQDQDRSSLNAMSQAVRGLVGLVFLFDFYTIYQHLLIHRIRRQLLEREELFHLISENAAEEALRRSEAHFRSVVEDAPYGIFRASIAGRFLQVNPALQKMLLYEEEQELLKRDLATEIFRHNGEKGINRKLRATAAVQMPLR